MDPDEDLDVTCTGCGHRMTTRLADWPDALEQNDPLLIVCPACGEPDTLRPTGADPDA